MKKIPKKITSIKQLFGTLPDDINLDDVKTERLTRKDKSPVKIIKQVKVQNKTGSVLK